MVSSVWLLAGAATAYGTYALAANMRKNLAAAKKSGLPYLILPCSPYWISWQLSYKLILPVIKLLPRSIWENQIDLMIPNWSYTHTHAPFARHGEVILLVSPFEVVVLTDNAEMIRQVTQRREQFPKMIETYAILRQFGDNVLTTEGALWRVHRKVTSASFNERNAALVFAESIRQTEGLCAMWLGADGQGNKTINTIDHDTMRLALNIIGYVGFGLRLLWPGQSLPATADPKLKKYSSLDAPEGYTMSFADAVAMMLDKILLLLVLPSWLLRLIPAKAVKEAAESRANYVKYMDDLYNDRVEDVRHGIRSEGMDLMGQLVRSRYDDEEAKTNNGQANGSSTKQKASGAATTGTLSKDEILGNAFIMLVAGHETTANALHFSMVLLAANPAAQRRLQRDIDAIFGAATDPHTWNYESNVNAMLASSLGASMNETLRLLPAVVEIPKKVVGRGGQVVTVDGRQHLLPENAMVLLSAVSAHRNPRYWPTRPSRFTPGQDDIDDFVPERWSRGPEARSFTLGGARLDDDASGTGSGVEDGEDFGGYSGPDTSAQLFRPERGAYIPFSEGARSCLGRRIAQVEILAALAVVFQRYSLELAVDEWATDDEVAAMDDKARGELYRVAQADTRRKIRMAETILTLKLHKSFVPVRLVKRGEERFVDRVDL